MNYRTMKSRGSLRARFAVANLAVVSLLTSLGWAEPQVTSSSHAGLGKGPLHVYSAAVSLPADGLWQVMDRELDESIRELYLFPTEPTRLRQLGTRMYEALEQRQVQAGRWHLQSGFEACRQYAQEHQGKGPAAIEDLASERRWKHVSVQWNRAPWRLNEWATFLDAESLEGPFVHLVAETPFQFAEADQQGATNRRSITSGLPDFKMVPKENRKVLAFELRPFVNDQRHWVLFTDGSCERVPIDAELLKSQNVEIRPVVSKPPSEAADARPHLEYQLVLVSSRPIQKTLRLATRNRILERDLEVDWDLTSSENGPEDDLRKRLMTARQFAWRPYRLATSGGVLEVWDQSGRDPSQMTDPPRTLSMFSVLGGRAAIEETLQLQNLIVSELAEEATVDIDTIPGVKVESHPFEAMLAGQPGGHLEVARFVPADRLFVYVGKPETIPAFLDSGAPFLASLGAVVTGNSLQYDLEARYLARLGMTREWVDTVLSSGLIREMAFFAPDLFFIDGTDVTVVAKLRQPQLLRGLLSILGASKLDSKSVLTLPTEAGRPAYLALRGDVLFVSTNRDELQESMSLYEQQGEGSLGASPEFRYMLTKLDVTEQTRFYAYFSDPFVRRLVGPRVKIGQRRRILEKAKMEALTAHAMLARLDGNTNPVSIEDLVKQNDLPDGWPATEMSVDETGLVRSNRYGTPPRMRTLPETPLENVTPSEAEAYRMYVENYSNYWRRFFDPIAIRLDEVGSDELELATFILPLVDNSIYNRLRVMIAHASDQSTLSIPVVEPSPVLQFSVNLKDEAWQLVAGNFADFFTRYSGASSAMLDDFGPSVHVCVFDADPIIAMGSGDIFGAFGGDVLRGGGNELLMVPVALSMLTRPCSIMVETKSPERTSQYLRQAALTGIGTPQRNREFNVSFYQVDDRDEWVWTMDIMGVVKLRYGVEVAGKYLVIRNIPWSSDDRVVSVRPAEYNGALLMANPAACEQQLPGLFAAASDVNRQVTMSGMGRLYPFLLGGDKSVDDAIDEHKRLFGFTPKQLAGDRWTWDDFRLVSQDFGEPTRQRQPAFDPDQPFGLMNRVESMQLNMQFEEDGLRSSVRWRLR